MSTSREKKILFVDKNILTPGGLGVKRAYQERQRAGLKDPRGYFMAYVIFDLDHTVIDSSHRQATLADGSLDLAHWFENNTPEKIALDSLLPLAASMRQIYAVGHTVIVCTARSIETPEIEKAHADFFAKHDLRFHAFLNREPGNMEGDATLKIRLLETYFRGLGFTSAREAAPIMFDDNLKVIAAMLEIGITCFDAKKQNERLAA